MFKKIAKTLALLSCTSFAAITQAANIYTLSGTQPFGFSGFPLFVQSWSQTATYTNVSITMPLADLSAPPISGVQGTAHLMR